MISTVAREVLMPRRLRIERQAETEFRAAFGKIARADLAAVRIDDRFADGEAESESALRRFAPAAMEFVEHAVVLHRTAVPVRCRRR